MSLERHNLFCSRNMHDLIIIGRRKEDIGISVSCVDWVELAENLIHAYKNYRESLIVKVDDIKIAKLPVMYVDCFLNVWIYENDR